jgi:hypothetical protein
LLAWVASGLMDGGMVRQAKMFKHSIVALKNELGQ